MLLVSCPPAGGRDVKTASEVTLKLLAGPLGVTDTLIRGLREELSVTRALTGKRPNIALVYDCDLTVDGRVLVVMEPLNGRSLSELIQQREPLPIEHALRLAFQIPEGLHAAHDVGLVHGAFTAEHVLVEGMARQGCRFRGRAAPGGGLGATTIDPAALSGGANGPRPRPSGRKS
jgi:serine/threonine-protein kinase